MLTALSHLLNGKVDPRVLERDWNFQARRVDVQAALAAASQAIDSGKIARLFDQARPQYPWYTQLREGLRRLRHVQSVGGWPSIAGGSTLKRSEEHTSELQSLMRISYAVFCLHTKKHPREYQHTRHANRNTTTTTHRQY